MSHSIESKDVLEAYRRELVAAGRSRGTINVRMSHARRLLESAGVRPAELNRGHLVTWLAAGEWSPAARASARASTRSLIRFMVAEHIIDDDIAADLPTVAIPRAVPAPAADPIVADAIARAPDDVALMIEIMAVAGLRRAECARVRGDDVQAAGRGWTLRVCGKGGHTRIVPIPSPLARKIARRRGWVFPGHDNGHISPGWLGKRVTRFLPDGVTPHKLRHRYASVAYAGTRDLRAVQSLLGHASVATTQTYIAVTGDSTRETAAEAWTIAA